MPHLVFAKFEGHPYVVLIPTLLSLPGLERLVSQSDKNTLVDSPLEFYRSVRGTKKGVEDGVHLQRFR